MSPSLGALTRQTAKIDGRHAVLRGDALCLGKLAWEPGALAAAELRLSGRDRCQDRPEAALRAELRFAAADPSGFLAVHADWRGIDLAHGFAQRWGR